MKKAAHSAQQSFGFAPAAPKYAVTAKTVTRRGPARDPIAERNVLRICFVWPKKPEAEEARRMLLCGHCVRLLGQLVEGTPDARGLRGEPVFRSAAVTCDRCWRTGVRDDPP